MAFEQFNLGPLTTVFTPPATCSSLELYEKDGIVSARSWAASCESSSTDRFINVASECFPPGFTSLAWDLDNPDAVDLSKSIPVYSPGYSCPADFTTACSLTRGVNDMPPEQFDSSMLWGAMKPGQTVIGCCPRGYSCGELDALPVFCYSMPALGEVLSGVYFDDDCAPIPTSVLVKEPIRHPPSAYRVQLIHRGPTGTLTTSTSRGIPPSPATGASNALSSPTGGTSPGTGATSDGLSSGAKIAIGISIPMVILIVSAITFLVFWRRWYSQTERPHVDPLEIEGKAELEGDQGTAFGRAEFDKPELHSDARVIELHSNGKAYEVHSDERAFELHCEDQVPRHHSETGGSNFHSNTRGSELVPTSFLRPASHDIEKYR